MISLPWGQVQENSNVISKHMQVVDLCATVLFFVMLALGSENYHSSWVLSLFLEINSSVPTVDESTAWDI